VSIRLDANADVREALDAELLRLARVVVAQDAASRSVGGLGGLDRSAAVATRVPVPVPSGTPSGLPVRLRPVTTAFGCPIGPSIGAPLPNVRRPGGAARARDRLAREVGDGLLLRRRLGGGLGRWRLGRGRGLGARLGAAALDDGLGRRYRRRLGRRLGLGLLDLLLLGLERHRVEDLEGDRVDLGEERHGRDEEERDRGDDVRADAEDDHAVEAQLAAPLIAGLAGVRLTPRPTLPVYPAQNLPSKPGLTEFIRVTLGRVEDKVIATPLPRGAGTITSLVRADGMLIVPALSEGLEEDRAVSAELLVTPEDIEGTLVVLGSHDNTIDLLATLLHRQDHRLRLSSGHVGSLGGLMALRQGRAHLGAATCWTPKPTPTTYPSSSAIWPACP